MQPSHAAPHWSEKVCDRSSCWPRSRSARSLAEAKASESVAIPGPGNKRGGVLWQEQPFVDKRRRCGLDLRDIAIAAAIAFFERVAKVVRRYTLGTGAGEWDQRPVAVGQFLRLGAVDVPAGVGAEWHRDRRQSDSG